MRSHPNLRRSSYRLASLHPYTLLADTLKLRASSPACRLVDPTPPQSLAEALLPTQRLSAITLDGDEVLVALSTGATVAVHALHSILQGQSAPIASWQAPDCELVTQVS